MLARYGGGAGQPRQVRDPFARSVEADKRAEKKKSVKQTGARVTLDGYAQSNARVSTLMRNIENSPWLTAPELIEIKSIALDK